MEDLSNFELFEVLVDFLPAVFSDLKGLGITLLVFDTLNAAMYAYLRKHKDNNYQGSETVYLLRYFLEYYITIIFDILLLRSNDGTLFALSILLTIVLLIVGTFKHVEIFTITYKRKSRCFKILYSLISIVASGIIMAITVSGLFSGSSWLGPVNILAMIIIAIFMVINMLKMLCYTCLSRD